jgi:hypothetical protein
MLLVEELALVALSPDSGRHPLGTRDRLNACLAGLLVGELVLEGGAGLAERDGVVPVEGWATGSATLGAAARVVASKGPRIKAVLSHMNRGLQGELGLGTWDAAVSGLVEAGVVSPAVEGSHPRHDVPGRAARHAVVDRLRAAAAGDEALDPRTALVLSMTGPARLLEVVAPERGARRHARTRIDHALDGSRLHPIGRVVRRLIADAEAAAAVV